MSLRLSIRPGFVAVCCLLLVLDEGILWLLLVSLAAHELGHLLALQCLGVEAATLTLGLGGGVIDCAPLERRQLAITALAGPAANLLWAGLLLLPAPEAALLNLCMAGFNLLPVPPLDGGVALRALAGERAVAPAAALTFGALLALAVALRAVLGLWPLLAAVWVLARALVENILVKRAAKG